MSIVSDVITTHLPPKRKQTPSGWLAFDAPCCIHNGETRDTKQRGGLITEGEHVSFHCFNCGFKTSWQPGRNISYKLRKFLEWINVPDSTITKLSLDVLRINEGIEAKEYLAQLPEFVTVPLPEDAVRLADHQWAEAGTIPEPMVKIFQYMLERNLRIDDIDYHWSPSLGYRDRLIIPFYYEGRIVGWTGRSINPDKKPKYLTEVQPGYVFNLDEQRYSKVFAIVCEGQIDALHVEGCALGGSEISDQQAMLLNRLNKDIIVVPDRDKAGSKLVEEAIELNWGVSMPEWSEDINDIGDAVQKYGRLYTLHSIVSAAETSPLKIRLRAKKWFG